MMMIRRQPKGRKNFRSKHLRLKSAFNLLWAQPQSNGPLYSNMVIGTCTGRWWVGCRLYQM